MATASQNEIWSRSEGDRWFRRNQGATSSLNDSPMLQMLARSISPGTLETALEIGCSDGQMSEAISNLFGITVTGIDPSQAAIESGNLRLQGTNELVSLEIGFGSSLPYDSETFDLVVAGFFLYAEERSLVLQSVSEADRVVRPGGYLVIVDFDFGRNVRRAYKHDSRLETFKADYPAWLLSTGHYHMVAKQSWTFDGLFFSPEPDSRVAATLLHKELEPYA